MASVGNIILQLFEWFFSTEVNLGPVTFSLGTFFLSLWVFTVSLCIIFKYLFGGRE